MATVQKNRANSLFTVEQETFIVGLFFKHGSGGDASSVGSATTVMREFRKKYRGRLNTRWLLGLKSTQFKVVFERFQKNGIAKSSPVQKGSKRTDQEKIELIQDWFIEFPMSSIREASGYLNISKTTVNRILKNSGMHPFKMHMGQNLTKAHMLGRVKFCQWLLEMPEDFIQLVFFLRCPSLFQTCAPSWSLACLRFSTNTLLVVVQTSSHNCRRSITF